MLYLEKNRVGLTHFGPEYANEPFENSDMPVEAWVYYLWPRTKVDWEN